MIGPDRKPSCTSPLLHAVRRKKPRAEPLTHFERALFMAGWCWTGAILGRRSPNHPVDGYQHLSNFVTRWSGPLGADKAHAAD
jgi:hypothetical protein